jgi:hypothetical protein
MWLATVPLPLWQQFRLNILYKQRARNNNSQASQRARHSILQIQIHEVLIFGRTLGTKRSKFVFERCRVRISVGSLTSLKYFVTFLSVPVEMSG